MTCGIRYSNVKVYLHWSSKSSAIKLKDNKYLFTIYKYHLWRKVWTNSIAEAVAFLRRSAAFVGGLLPTFRDTFRGQEREPPPSPTPLKMGPTGWPENSETNLRRSVTQKSEGLKQTAVEPRNFTKSIASPLSRGLISFAFLLNQTSRHSSVIVKHVELCNKAYKSYLLSQSNLAQQTDAQGTRIVILHVMIRRLPISVKTSYSIRTT